MKEKNRLVILAFLVLLLCVGGGAAIYFVLSGLPSGSSAGSDSSVEFEEPQNRQTVGGTVTSGRTAEGGATVGPVSGQERINFLNNLTASVDANGTVPAGMPLVTSLQAQNFVGGKTTWLGMKLGAGTGEEISLANVTIEVTTQNDPQKIFDESFSFGSGTILTDAAYVIKADGTKVKSGPANQPGKFVVVAVGLKFFNNTQQEVQTYFDANPGISVTVRFKIKGEVALTLVFQHRRGELPDLSIVKSGANVIIKVENNGDPTAYTLWRQTAVNSTVGAVNLGTVRAGDSKTDVRIGPTGFYRLRP